MNKISEKLWNGNYLRVWIANFLLYFSFMLLTPLFPLYLSETFDADKQMIGMVLSGYTLTALLVRPFSGYLVDSFPRRTVLLISFFLFFLLFIGYPLSATLLLFFVVRTLHGAPFGLATVSNSTVAIDVLPASRRAEGIGYYGLSNNIATAISPSIALLIYGMTGNYDLLFILAIVFSGLAFYCNYTLKLQPRQTFARPPISLDRFILLKAWRQGFCVACFSFSYGIISTYVAIYGKEELGITGGTGVFFMLLSIGLILSRLTGSRTLRQGKIIHNATIGVLVSLVGYLLFASLHNYWGYYGAAFIIGLGNGHMFPAFQSMFLNLASNDQRGTANSTLYVSWDTGVGIGVLLGGVIAEYWGYHAAFWNMWIINAVGVLFYFISARKYFILNKLR
ncbi:MAG: MFS transporter [Bacteroidaceae bacterium]|nr:MFS transporter [Bacteroidaceae bacterium]